MNKLWNVDSTQALRIATSACARRGFRFAS